MPTLLILSAGASFTPSPVSGRARMSRPAGVEHKPVDCNRPVTATTWLQRLASVTLLCFCKQKPTQHEKRKILKTRRQERARFIGERDLLRGGAGKDQLVKAEDPCAQRQAQHKSDHTKKQTQQLTKHQGSKEQPNAQKAAHTHSSTSSCRIWGCLRPLPPEPSRCVGPHAN
jgi:hypothetical protein